MQVWGLRFSAYVVPERDRALFTVARLPDDLATRNDLEHLADRVEAFLDGQPMDCRELARGLGRAPGSLRYAALTGRVAIRWDGARQPTVWTVPRPAVDPFAARVELAAPLLPRLRADDGRRVRSVGRDQASPRLVQRSTRSPQS